MGWPFSISDIASRHKKKLTLSSEESICLAIMLPNEQENYSSLIYLTVCLPGIHDN